MTRKIYLLYVAIIIALLCLPGVRLVYLGGSDGTLNGYSQSISTQSSLAVDNVLNKRFQKWVESYFSSNFGFRALLVRSFNELTFRAYKQIPHLKLYSTPFNGLYSTMTIESLNQEVQMRSKLEAEYEAEAKRLLAIQQYLESQGKVFITVIAASKAYVYPEGLGGKYILNGTEDIWLKAANYGDVLKKVGVNVIDSRPMLRDFVQQTNISTHADSGVHWNYYAGCLVAEKIMSIVQKTRPEFDTISCGIPVYESAKKVDVDGLSLLNIWSNGGFNNAVPYPSIPKQRSKVMPSFVFIGDSFSDQIRDAIHDASAASKLVFSSYFHTRAVSNQNEPYLTTHGKDSDPEVLRFAISNDIDESDVVIYETVDYHHTASGSYGLTDYFLKRPELQKLLSEQTSTNLQHAVDSDKLGLQRMAEKRACSSIDCVANIKYSVLAYVAQSSSANPMPIPSELSFARSLEDLPQLAAENNPDFIAALGVNVEKYPELVKLIKKLGYTLLVNNNQYWIAYNASNVNLVRSSSSSGLSWEAYNKTSGVISKVSSSGLPYVESVNLVDSGMVTPNVQFPKTTLILASFSGNVSSTQEQAAHLSFYGVRAPIISLKSGSYTLKDQYIGVLPSEFADREVRLAFGLGGWGLGKGALRINDLSIYHLEKISNDPN